MADLDVTEKQVFGDAGVDLAMLIPLTVRPMANPEHEAAVCGAATVVRARSAALGV